MRTPSWTASHGTPPRAPVHGYGVQRCTFYGTASTLYAPRMCRAPHRPVRPMHVHSTQHGQGMRTAADAAGVGALTQAALRGGPDRLELLDDASPTACGPLGPVTLPGRASERRGCLYVPPPVLLCTRLPCCPAAPTVRCPSHPLCACTASHTACPTCVDGATLCTAKQIDTTHNILQFAVQSTLLPLQLIKGACQVAVGFFHHLILMLHLLPLLGEPAVRLFKLRSAGGQRGMECVCGEG